MDLTSELHLGLIFWVLFRTCWSRGLKKDGFVGPRTLQELTFNKTDSTNYTKGCGICSEWSEWVILQNRKPLAQIKITLSFGRLSKPQIVLGIIWAEISPAANPGIISATSFFIIFKGVSQFCLESGVGPDLMGWSGGRGKASRGYPCSRRLRTGAHQKV